MRRASLQWLLRTVLPLLVVTGCARGGPDAEGDMEVLVQRYEVRGEVTRLPSAEADALYVRHESIPGFVGVEGEVVGMGSMTMPFPLAEGVELDGVAIGDKVGFTLEVAWEEDPSYRITRVEVLGAETVLDLGD